MYWVITKDLLDGDSRSSSKGTGYYPRSIAEGDRHLGSEATRQWIAKAQFEFRLLDDDDQPYYEGVCGNLLEASGDAAFAPLDWAEGFAGCTGMQFRRVGATKWEWL